MEPAPAKANVADESIIKEVNKEFLRPHHWYLFPMNGATDKKEI